MDIEEAEHILKGRGIVLDQEEIGFLTELVKLDSSILNNENYSLIYLFGEIASDLSWGKVNWPIKVEFSKDSQTEIEDTVIMYNWIQLFLEILLSRNGKRKKLISGLLYFYIGLSLEYLKTEKYLLANKLLFRIKELAKQYEDKEVLAQTLLELGSAYKTVLNLNHSRLAYKDALRLFKQLGDDANIAEVAARLAALEIYQGRTVDARKHLTQAKAYFEMQGETEKIVKMDELFDAADYVDGGLMLQGRL